MNEEMPFIPPPPASMTNRYANMVRNGGGVRRRNAGSITGKSPLIITGGAARHAEFHYQFTEPGKFKRKPQGEMDFSVLGQVGVKEAAERVKYRLPWNYCPDCDRNDIPRHKAKWLGLWMVSEPHENISLVPGDTLVHTKCADCVDAEVTGKVDLELPIQGDESVQEYYLNQIRANRMERNICSYVRNCLMAKNYSIVVSSEERERLGVQADADR